MKRSQLEHILRAAAAITGEREFIVIGSQAVLGQYPHAPKSLLESMEADIFAADSTTSTDLIDGSIGEGSPFHQSFGYFAHGVGEKTAVLPDGWRDRLIVVKSEETGGAVGRCLEVHDLAIAKVIAGRDKDIAFVTDLAQHRLVDAHTLKERLEKTALPAILKEACAARLERILSKSR